jgi:adenylate cyclase
VLPSIRQSESERVKGMRPQDMSAYQLCLSAYPLLTAATAPDTRHALDLLHRAIERDPDYALPMAFAAWGYAQLVMQLGSASPAEDRATALRLSTQAGALDHLDPLVLTARSVVQTMADDRLYADDLVRRALARRPSLAWAWERSGWLRAYAADMRGATTHFGRALRLDPSNPAKTTLALAGISAGLFDRGRYELAARWMRRTLELEPGAAWINRTLAVTYAQLGERGLAAQSLEALRRYRPGIRIRDVVSAMHFAPEFVSRVANGLDDLGLPP